MQATSAAIPRRWFPETPEGELAAALVRAVRQFKTLHGADPASVACLGTLMRLGPIRISSLADELALDISTASRHVSNLESAGWLTRENDPADRRATLLTLTADGADYIKGLLRQRSQAIRAATQAWPAGDLATLTDLINRLADDLGADH